MFYVIAKNIDYDIDIDNGYIVMSCGVNNDILILAHEFNEELKL